MDPGEQLFPADAQFPEKRPHSAATGASVLPLSCALLVVCTLCTGESPRTRRHSRKTPPSWRRAVCGITSTPCSRTARASCGLALTKRSIGLTRELRPLRTTACGRLTLMSAM